MSWGLILRITDFPTLGYISIFLCSAGEGLKKLL